MYDRRAIMTAAHRHYEERVERVTKAAAEFNALIKRSKAQGKPAPRVLARELRTLWIVSLRAAWAEAKAAVRAAQPVSRIDALRAELAYVEAADRGYDACRAAALRAEISARAAAAPVLSSLTCDPTLQRIFRGLEDDGAGVAAPIFRPRPIAPAAARVRELVDA